MNLTEAIEKRGLKEEPIGSLELDRRGGYGNWAMLSMSLSLKRNVGRSPIRLNAQRVATLVTTVGARVPECWEVEGPGAITANLAGYDIDSIEYTEDGLVEHITFKWAGSGEHWGSCIPAFKELLNRPEFATRINKGIITIHRSNCSCSLHAPDTDIWTHEQTYYDIVNIVQHCKPHWCSRCNAYVTYKLYTYRATCVEEFTKHGRVSQFDDDTLY